MCKNEELDALEAIKQAAEIDAENNYRVLDNHLKGSALVVANLAALNSVKGNDGAAELLRAASANPT